MARRPVAPVLAALLSACISPTRQAARPDAVLAGFRGTSAVLSSAMDRAEALAVFPRVQWTEAGCVHEGVLVHRDGRRDPVWLRCLDAPTAPAGYGSHRLVVLQDPAAVARIAAGGLDLDGWPALHPDDLERAVPADDAPGWSLSTRRPHLLFADEEPRLRLEPAPARTLGKP